MSDVTLHCGDCLEYMRQMEPCSVDAVVTDPPYGINVEVLPNNSERWSNPPDIEKKIMEWDTSRADWSIQDILRVSYNQVIFGGNYYSDLLPASSSWIVWDKLNSGNFADAELAWTSHKKAVRVFRYLWNGFRKQKPEQRHHPTQKPLALMLWIIENYTNPGDTILDPFAGSGTTGVACVQLGRNFIGIEKEPAYFEIMQRRIKQAQMQLRLEI